MIFIINFAHTSTSPTGKYNDERHFYDAELAIRLLK